MGDVNPKQITIDSYNQTADEYAMRVAGLYLHKDAKTFRSFLKKGSLILDHGCGSGRDAKAFTEKGCKVIGIDLSEKMLEIARRTAPEAEFRLMDIVELDFPDNYFDSVWSVASLLHVPKAEIPSAIHEVYRVLKKDGIFYLTVKQGSGEILKPDERYGGVQKFWSYFSKDEMESYLKKFTILKSYIDKDEYTSWIDIFCRK